MPAFPLCQGGVVIFQGTDNNDIFDCAYVDYELTMPWVSVEGHKITTENGLTIEFLELGKKVRISYKSHDGKCAFDMVQDAVTPLIARGHIIPGEEVNSDTNRTPGGTEQMMHCTGWLELNGERYDIDCYPARDRSFNQVRTESRAKAARVPPVGWSPMYFGEDLIFCQVSFEDPVTNPTWKNLYTIPEDRPTHHFAWMMENGKSVNITKIIRDVKEHHPVTHAALRQTVEAHLEDGRILKFKGEAVAMSRILAWPNASIRVGVYRWEDEQGRVATNTYQEMWFDQDYQHMMNNRSKG